MKKILITGMLLCVNFGITIISPADASQTDVDLMESLMRATSLRYPTYPSDQLADEMFMMYYDYRRLCNACAALHNVTGGQNWVMELIKSVDTSKPFCELRKLRQHLSALTGEATIKRLDDRIPNLGWLPGSGVSEVPCDPLVRWYGVVGDFGISQSDS